MTWWMWYAAGMITMAVIDLLYDHNRARTGGPIRERDTAGYSDTPAERWAYHKQKWHPTGTDNREVWRWQRDGWQHRLKRRLWCRHAHVSCGRRSVCNSCAVY